MIFIIRPNTATNIMIPLATDSGCMILKMPSYIIPNEITINAKPFKKATIISNLKIHTYNVSLEVYLQNK